MKNKENTLELNNDNINYHIEVLNLEIEGYENSTANINNSLELAGSYYNLGHIYLHWKKDYNKAIEYYTTSLDVILDTHQILNTYQNISDPLIISIYNDLIKIYTEVGNVNQEKGNYDKAIECYSYALEEKLKIYSNNHLSIADSYNDLGATFTGKGLLRSATNYFNDALDIKNTCQNEQQQNPRINHFGKEEKSDLPDNLSNSLIKISLDCKNKMADFLKNYHWPDGIAEIEILNCEDRELFNKINFPKSLTILTLDGCNITSFTGFDAPNIKELSITICKNLVSLEGLYIPKATKVEIVDCDNLTSLSGMYTLGLNEIDTTFCGELTISEYFIDNYIITNITTEDFFDHNFITERNISLINYASKKLTANELPIDLLFSHYFDKCNKKILSENYKQITGEDFSDDIIARKQAETRELIKNFPSNDIELYEDVIDIITNYFVEDEANYQGFFPIDIVDLEL